MKIWRVNHHSNSDGNNKNTNSSKNTDVVVLGGTTSYSKAATKHQQQQQSTKTAFEMKDATANLKNSSHRMPSLLFLSTPEPNPLTVPLDDTRNDMFTNSAMDSSPNGIEKKEVRKQNMMKNTGIGRSNNNNDKKKNNHPTTRETTPARRSSSRRDLPEGEVMTMNHNNKNNNTLIAATYKSSTPRAASPSSALSRLLFTKQHMEQLEQMKVVYTQFGSSAMDLLTIEPDDCCGMPSPEQADHVVVKVQVRK